MSIRETRFSDGRHFLFLAETPWGVPDLWVVGFCVRMLVPKDNDASTIRNVLEGIAKGRKYFATEREAADLRKRALQGPLTDDELAGLAAACRRREGGGKPLENASVHYWYFLKYYNWLRKQPSDEPVAAVTDRAEKSATIAAKDHAPTRRKKTSRDEKLGLTVAQRDTFLRVISATDDDNPFGNDVVFRNFVLLWISYHHGLRTGELLGLKIGDVQLAGDACCLKVVVRRNDPEDPRIPAAAQKTLGRVLPIEDTTALMLDHLFAERRMLMRSKRAAKHPFLFTNVDGAPLSARALRNVFETLRTAVPALAGLINHQLRHDWNDRWVNHVEDSGLNAVSALETQLYAMGWMRGSPMTSIYGVRSRRAAANKILREAQRRNLRRKGP